MNASLGTLAWALAAVVNVVVAIAVLRSTVMFDSAWSLVFACGAAIVCTAALAQRDDGTPPP